MFKIVREIEVNRWRSNFRKVRGSNPEFKIFKKYEIVSFFDFFSELFLILSKNQSNFTSQFPALKLQKKKNPMKNQVCTKLKMAI